MRGGGSPAQATVYTATYIGFLLFTQMSDFQGPATSRGEFFFFKVMGQMGTQKKRIWLTASKQKTIIRYDYRVLRNEHKSEKSKNIQTKPTAFLVFGLFNPPPHPTPRHSSYN